MFGFFMKNNNHKCEALVLCCIDFRFHQKFLRYVKKDLGVKIFDIVALAGGAKNISSPSEAYFRDIILKNIEISVKLHNIQKIIITNHIDCGAYGGSKKFKNEKQEIDFYKRELRKAKKIVGRRFPNLKIKTHVIQ